MLVQLHFHRYLLLLKIHYDEEFYLIEIKSYKHSLSFSLSNPYEYSYEIEQLDNQHRISHHYVDPYEPDMQSRNIQYYTHLFTLANCNETIEYLTASINLLINVIDSLSFYI